MTTVLCRIAYPFASCRAEWCRRALATSAYSEPSSPSPMPLKLNRKPDTSKIRFNPDELLHPRLFVRPWDGIPSMVDGFAMLRGIERKYGKIKTFKFIRDGEIPSTYFSYFWVELEDPSKCSDAASTILQIPVPEVERRRPGGVGISDLHPFLRPSPEDQEGIHEWTGVTERMVDEVDESKRTGKVFDLRLELSGSSGAPFQILEKGKYLVLNEAFIKWGGFAPCPVQGTEAAGPSARPTLDLLIERAAKTERRSPARKDGAPPVKEERRKSFNYEFDEPVHSTGTQTPVPSQAEKGSPEEKSQSLLTMQREGKRLSKKQKALLQAAAISRTPLPDFGENALDKAKEKEERESDGGEAAQGTRSEIDEENKRIHSGVWNLVRAKWF